MFEKPEDILNTEVDNLMKNEKDFKVSVDPLAQIAASLYSLPKKGVPAPSKRRRYLAQIPARRTIYNRGIRLITYGLSSTLVCAMILTGIAINNTEAGNTGFTVKKTAERIRVNLATNPEAKAKLETKLAEKRLDEAKQTIATTQNNPKATTAVLTELTKQTEVAVHKIEAAVQEEALPEHLEIAEKLDDIAKSQLALVASVSSTPEAETETNKQLTATIEEVSKQIETIKKMIVAKIETSPVNTAEVKGDETVAEVTPSPTLEPTPTQAAGASTSKPAPKKTEPKPSPTPAPEPTPSPEPTIKPLQAEANYILESPEPETIP